MDHGGVKEGEKQKGVSSSSVNHGTALTTHFRGKEPPSPLASELLASSV